MGRQQYSSNRRPPSVQRGYPRGGKLFIRLLHISVIAADITLAVIMDLAAAVS